MGIIKGLAYAALLSLLGADRRGGGRDRLSAELRRPHQALRPRADDPRPRRQRPGAGLDRPELRPVADLRPDPAGNAGGDDLDRGPALPQPYRRRPDRHRPRDRVRRSAAATGCSATSTITQQLARNIFLTNNRNFVRKIKEGDPGARARAQVQQGPDPRALSQPRLFRRRRLWHRRGIAEILRPRRRPSQPWRSGDHRRAWSRRRPTIRRPPTSRPRAARSGVVLQTDGQEWLHHSRDAAAVDPAQVRIQQTTSQNSVRYFTDWALPQLDTLDRPDQRADRRVDDARSRHAGRRRPRDPRQCARRHAGRAGGDRPRRRGPGDGRRQGLCRRRSTTARPRRSASRDRRSSCSSISPRSNSGMKPTDTIVDEPVTIDGWSPRNSTRTNLGPVTLREAFSRSINTISAKIGAQVGFSTIADMARRFGITTPISTYPSMVLGTQRRAADRHDPRLRFGRQQGRRGHALRNSPRRHRRRAHALPARGRRRARARRAMGRGRDDRPAAVGGAVGHRPRRADRPSGGGQDRHHHAPTRTAGSSAFRAG